MKILQKTQRVIAVLLLTMVLFTVSVKSSVALGAYAPATLPTSQPAENQMVAVPAVALAAYGVVLVAAFAYGVYTGYGQDPASEVVAMEAYQSDDFSKFDPVVAP